MGGCLVMQVGDGSKWDAAIVKATQTACRYSHRKHNHHHHHIAFQSLAQNIEIVQKGRK